MASGYYRFEHFSLHLSDRQLCQQGKTVELNARYFDALALLLQAHGKLVTKEQFFNEVWHGVPVTDEALTQCIKTLRKQLGDSASRPRYIETVPKYGYRFIAEALWVNDNEASDDIEHVSATLASLSEVPDRGHRVLSSGAAGTLGGAVAGLLGGLMLGWGVSGSASVMVVMIFLCVAIAVSGAAGVAFGMETAVRVAGNSFYTFTIGGAVGGMLIGAAGQLIGADTFNLLFGQSPGEITGAPEGFVLGAATGLAVWMTTGKANTWRRVWSTGTVCGGIAGGLIMLAGGQLMSRSLHALAQSFPQSRLRVDAIGALFGENGFGTISQLAVGTLEGGLFAACVVFAMWFSRRHGG